MKKNDKFKIEKFFWPGVAAAVLIVVVVWANMGVFGKAPAAGPLLDQPLPSPALQLPSQVLNQGVGQGVDQGTALTVQEGISQVVSLVRPAVVGVYRDGLGAAADPAAGTVYLNPAPGKTGRMGSGIIVHNSGYVLTTFQTVGRADKVRVVLFSGGNRHYEADVVQVNPATDLALLKILSREVFPTAVLGDSNLLEVGDIVLAMGTPFGFSGTVTMGIVSSNNRKVNINGIKYPDLIQTDAAVNEGNDGGPLVNVKGQVVGVNMATYMPDHRYSGIGFSVPINDALGLLDGLAR
jgi:serine protease Do